MNQSITRLKNEKFQLSFWPGIGCYWKSLKINLNDDWVDLITPVPEGKLPLNLELRAGSYLLAPFSNRLADATLHFKGKEYPLRVNFPDGTAIHGDVYERPWVTDEVSETTFSAHIDSASIPNFNYPFPIKVFHQIRLDGNRLKLDIHIENPNSFEIPVGLGIHPFFNRRLTNNDKDLHLKLPAPRIYPLSAAMPSGPSVPVPSSLDFRKGSEVGPHALDDCFTGFSGGEAILTYAGSGVRVKMQMDAIFTHMVCYAPVDASGKPQDFAAIEPVTNVNNGINLYEKGWTGTGVYLLAPGKTWGGAVSIVIENFPPTN